MDACALSGAWDVVWTVRWGQNFVDDVNDTVACADIREGHRCVVDHHATINSEGKRLAVDGVCGHAVSHSGGWNFSIDYVVEQDVGQCSFSFRRVKCGEVDASISEGLIGWCEEREWSSALQCFQQFCLDYTGDERVVNTGALSSAWDVVWCI